MKTRKKRKDIFKIEDIKLFFISKGYIPLFDLYEKNTQLLECKCPNGHVIHISYAYLQRGIRCKICNVLKQRYKIEDVKNIFILEGYTPLFDVYKRNKQLLKCKCPNGHLWNARLNDFRRGIRCRKCYNVSVIDRYKKENETDYILYRKIVKRITEKNYRTYKNIINPNNYKRERGLYGYHLDHRISIFEGYEQNIPPYLIGSSANLTMLKGIDNYKKNYKSSITIETLIEQVKNIDA